MEMLKFEPGKLGEIPGPRSKALLARRQRAVPRGLYSYHPIFIRRGKGP